ncbi:TPA: hypothetical protein ACH3X2_001175 [Trebouxia sp. C0005]
MTMSCRLSNSPLPLETNDCRAALHVIHRAGLWHSTADPGQAAPEPGYGYKGKLDHILKTEFPHLNSKVYADHAGATLYSKSQIDAFRQDLASHLFGNPHSQHGWSGNEGSAQAVAEARQLTLQMCTCPML